MPDPAPTETGGDVSGEQLLPSLWALIKQDWRNAVYFITMGFMAGILVGAIIGILFGHPSDLTFCDWTMP